MSQQQRFARKDGHRPVAREGDEKSRQVDAIGAAVAGHKHVRGATANRRSRTFLLTAARPAETTATGSGRGLPRQQQRRPRENVLGISCHGA